MQFDGKLRLGFHGAKIRSGAGLLAFRELDEAFRLSMHQADGDWLVAGGIAKLGSKPAHDTSRQSAAGPRGSTGRSNVAKNRQAGQKVKWQMSVECRMVGTIHPGAKNR
jgi:hypothetical protein